ncbi:hypothetical protein [Tateyamaria sp.]|uniref:hypothetical protein n=1 Tax=Tateyamaria sp. TaxID=1929288 RepID=UPI003B2149FC
MAWHLLIKKIDWSKFEWLKFDWKNILPDWGWGSIIPSLRKVDFEAEARASVVPSGSLDVSEMTAKQREILERHNKWRERVHGVPAPAIEISNPETLLEAARAAERLETQFPKITEAANAALQAGGNALSQISTLFAAADFTSEGARLMQTLADGIRSKLAEVQAAAREITQAIQGALPRSATMNIGVQGGAPVQERARGGSFAPGWLLTGENGPELEYRTRGGFIAHNQALRNMVAMSETVARNSANANRAPGWLKGAALATGIAASAAMPAAAFDAGADGSADGSAAIGAKYLTERNSGLGGGTGPISINMTFNGTVDRQVLPDLHAMKDEMLEALLDHLEEDGRAVRRREHK